jgi:hypothetical protein
VSAAWRKQSQISVVGKFGGTQSGTLGKVAFGQCLNTPGNALNQPDAIVACAGIVAKQIGEFTAQLVIAHFTQRSELVGDIQIHGVL